MNLSDIWMDRVGTRIKPIKGIRWHALFTNVDVAIRNFDSMISILKEFNTHKNSKLLLELLQKNAILAGMVSTSLAGEFLQSKWNDLTKKQTKSQFLAELSNLKKFAEEVDRSTNEEMINLSQSVYKPEDFKQIQTISRKIIDVNLFRKNHKKNFNGLISYIIKNSKPNNETNLTKMIGMILIFYLFF